MTQVGVVGTVTVTALVDANASKGMRAALIAATTLAGAMVRVTDKGIHRAVVAPRKTLVESVGSETAGAASDVVTGAPAKGGPTATAGDQGAPTTTQGEEVLGTGTMIVEVGRRSVSAFLSPVCLKRLSRPILSEAPGTSYVLWDAPTPRTSPATW